MSAVLRSGLLALEPLATVFRGALSFLFTNAASPEKTHSKCKIVTTYFPIFKIDEPVI